MKEDKFNHIRPYYDSEVNEVVKILIQNKNFINFISQNIFNGNVKDFLPCISEISSINDFQINVSSKFIDRLIRKTISDLSISGIEKIDNNESYLFISTHRDIVLDSALLQMCFFNNSIKTTRTAIGNNLVPNQLLLDIAKLNKMFLVIRDGSIRELLENSIILSEYIRDSIEKEKESIWIAQRNGRTKDGDDKTQQGLLKMLTSSNKKNVIESLLNLNIIPLAISYQFETCDDLKATETIISSNGVYRKRPAEDIRSIEMGISQYKGNVHISIGNSINDKLLSINKNISENEKLKLVSNIIDNEIYSIYKLWNNNYIAADLIEQQNNYSNNYSIEEKNNFIAYIDKKVEETHLDKEHFRDTILKIYANPVFNKNS